MIVTTSHSSPQQNLMAINTDDYIILKSNEQITFQQNVFRIVKSVLRQEKDKSIFSDLSKLTIKDDNVLYELKQKEGYKYNANFEIEVSIKWNYFLEYLNVGILHHINAGENKFVNLQGNNEQILNNVLMSPTKENYEKREECIKKVIEKNIGHIFNLCLVDPDRNKTHPKEPIFSLI